MIGRLLDLIPGQVLLGIAAAALAAAALAGWLYAGALEDLGAARADLRDSRAKVEEVSEASDANLGAFRTCSADLTRVSGELAAAGERVAAAEARVTAEARATATIIDRLRREREAQRENDPIYGGWARGPAPRVVFERLRAASRGPGGAAALPGPEAGPPPGAPDAGPADPRDP